MFLVSAQDALLSRLILANKATDKERERFAKRAFGKRWQRASEADYVETALDMLDDSQVESLENSLLGYLYDHAGILKLVSLLDGIMKLLTQASSLIPPICPLQPLWDLARRRSARLGSKQ